MQPVPIYPRPLTQSLPTIGIHQQCVFVTVKHPASYIDTTSDYHPKSIVSVSTVSFPWGPFCGFAQMYDDMYPPLYPHTEQFHCPNNPLHLLTPSSSLWYPWSFYCLPSFAFSRMSYIVVGIPRYVVFFHSVICT